MSRPTSQTRTPRTTLRQAHKANDEKIKVLLGERERITSEMSEKDGYGYVEKINENLKELGYEGDGSCKLGPSGCVASGGRKKSKRKKTARRGRKKTARRGKKTARRGKKEKRRGTKKRK